MMRKSEMRTISLGGVIYGNYNPNHMCGVVGIIGSPDASREAFLGLTTLQHRGQDAAGILSYDHEGFHCVKNRGLVESVFSRESMESLSGSMAIGHARYSTIGRGDTSDIQPLLLSYPFGLGLVHNGNIVNYEEIAIRLKRSERRQLLTQSDSEALLHLLAMGLEKGELNFDQICNAISALSRAAHGSYSVVSLIADHGLVAFRDPNGIRPLVWGKKKISSEEGSFEQLFEAHMVASESVALSFNEYEVVRNLEPGEVLYIDQSGHVHSRVLNFQKKRPCMFEWVYFASPESVIEEIPVYRTRIQLGKRLAAKVKRYMQQHSIHPDLVVPVPETSRIAAIALSEELELPYREVLIKNRYIKRTFIMDNQDRREKAVNLKLSPVRSEIEGKNLLLVDDSIVRGTTSRKLIELVRRAGAKEVYFVSTCPPIQSPCYYGIDFPNGTELVAYQKSQEEIKEALGADWVIYQDLDDLKKAISSEVDPCTACLGGSYPTDISAGQRFAQTRKQHQEQQSPLVSI